jgi:hypothetical protein
MARESTPPPRTTAMRRAGMRKTLAQLGAQRVSEPWPEAPAAEVGPIETPGSRDHPEAQAAQFGKNHLPGQTSCYMDIVSTWAALAFPPAIGQVSVTLAEPVPRPDDHVGRIQQRIPWRLCLGGVREAGP